MDTVGKIESWHYIPDGSLPGLKAAVDKLAKRAAKLGVPAPGLLVGDPWDEADAKGRIKRRWPVIVLGVAPKYNGWSLVAVLEHLTGNGEGSGDEVIVRTVPGMDCPAGYRSHTERDCDHCKTYRKRLDTYVLGHENGAYAHVGSTCLKDFLGHTSPHNIAAWYEILLSLRDLGAAHEGGGGYEEERWMLETFLTLTAAEIREHGWVSKAEAARTMGEKESTASMVLYHLTCRHGTKPPCKHPEITAADHATAEKATEWALGLAGDTDYEHNIKVIAKVGVVERRTAGFAASIVSSHLRHLEREFARKREAEKAATSEYFGEVGKRGVYPLTVTKCHRFEGHYGVTTLFRFVTPEGNVAVWFASGSWGRDPGETMLLAATVKKHAERNGVKETMLTRCMEVVACPCCGKPEVKAGFPAGTLCTKCHKKTAAGKPCTHKEAA